VVLEIKLGLMTVFQKIYVDISIAMANNALALQVHTENITMVIYQKLPP
jgi:hypothetical protein